MNAVAELVDRDASEIGELYAKAKSSIVESVRYQFACGQRLAEKKAALGHGEWLPWLRANQAVLGFGERAAQLLIRGTENTKLTADSEPLTESRAIEISRTLWGNSPTPLMLQSNSVEWYTPAEYVEAARTVMGGIDLDPASSAAANETVQAAQFFTESDDGLSRQWHGRVWLNPPYGGQAGGFIAKLTESCASGEVSAAVVLVNAHCTHTDWFQPLWSGVLCFTDHRIAFVPGSGQNDVSGSTFGSVFVYFGDAPRRFALEFSRFGNVVQRVPA